MSFAPSPEGVNQLLGLFRASQSADNAQHRAIQQQLTSFNAVVRAQPSTSHPTRNLLCAHFSSPGRVQLLPLLHFQCSQVGSGSCAADGRAGLEEQPEGALGLAAARCARVGWPAISFCARVCARARARAYVACEKPLLASHSYVRESLLGCVGDPEAYIRATVRVRPPTRTRAHRHRRRCQHRQRRRRALTHERRRPMPGGQLHHNGHFWSRLASVAPTHSKPVPGVPASPAYSGPRIRLQTSSRRTDDSLRRCWITRMPTSWMAHCLRLPRPPLCTIWSSCEMLPSQLPLRVLSLLEPIGRCARIRPRNWLPTTRRPVGGRTLACLDAQ